MDGCSSQTFMDVHRAVDVPLISSNDIAGEVGFGNSSGMADTVNHAEVGVMASSGMVGTFNDDVTRASESDHRSMVLCSHPPTASINRATMGTSAGASRSTHRRINNFYLDILCSPYTEVVDKFVLPFSLVLAWRNASRARQTRPNTTTGVYFNQCYGCVLLQLKMFYKNFFRLPLIQHFFTSFFPSRR